MRSTFKVAFFLKRSAKKSNAHVPIIARITVDKKTVQFSTKLEIIPGQWSVKLQCATNHSAEAIAVNQTLESIKVAIHNHYHAI